MSRGFGSFDPEKLREVSSRGGKNATNRHKFTSEEASAAGKKAHHQGRGRRIKPQEDRADYGEELV